MSDQGKPPDLTSKDGGWRLQGRELLAAIRAKPTLYLGTRSLTALAHFMSGYDHALRAHAIAAVSSLRPPLEFHDWTAYRLHFPESTRGWLNMILDRTGNESLALDRFYELFDEFENRRGRVVAKLTGSKEQYFSVLDDGTSIARSYPSPLLLLAYTDDPGFFVASEDPKENFPGKGFCPSLERFRLRLSISPMDLEIVDRTAFDRYAAGQKET